MSARPSPLVEGAAVVAALLAIAIAGTYPLIGHLGTHLPNDLGDPVLNAWILAWDASALARGGAHLWDAPNFFPYLHALAYSDHLLGIALFTAPLQWLSGNAVLVYNVAFIGAFVGAGAGMYLLARTLTGRRDAAFVGAVVVFALAPIVRVYAWVRADRGFTRTPIEIQAYSADVSEYFRGHHLVRLWRRAPHGTGEHELFPGGVALALSAVALATARGRSRWYVVLYAVITGVAFMLSLGPLPSAWGHQAPIAGPYRLMLSAVPGLDGLRAVARIAVIVLLGLSVLAAFGTTALLARLSPRWRIAVPVAPSVAIVGEGWAAPIPIARFDPFGGDADRRAYEFVRDSGPGPVVDLPLSLDHHERELRYQYLTLVHGQRTLNGSTSYDTTIHRFLGLADQSPLADVDRMDVAVGFLRGMGVRYVIVHARDFDEPAAAAAVLTGLQSDHHGVAAR